MGFALVGRRCFHSAEIVNLFSGCGVMSERVLQFVWFEPQIKVGDSTSSNCYASLVWDKLWIIPMPIFRDALIRKISGKFY